MQARERAQSAAGRKQITNDTAEKCCKSQSCPRVFMHVAISCFAHIPSGFSCLFLPILQFVGDFSSFHRANLFPPWDFPSGGQPDWKDDTV